MALQNLRSNTANKRPTASGMVDGQVAINTNATNPGLFFKDAGDGIRKVGPVFIGSSAPNSSPAAGGSSGHSIGEQWLDTSGSRYVVKTWDGTAWRDDDSNYLQLTGGALSGALTIDNAANVAALDLKFDGDTDTGFYAPAANTLGFVNGGTEHLRIDSFGRVGIGTTSPGNTLHLKGAQGVGIRIENSTSTNSSYLTIESGDKYQFNVGGSGYYTWLTGGSEKLRIDSSGNLGVGDSSPDARCVVYRPTQFSGNTVFAVKSDAGSTKSTKFMVDGDGQVGIGTSSPSALLDCELGTTGTIAQFRGADTDILNIDGDSNQITLDSRNVGALAFEMQGSEAMRIDSSGNVGIGVSSPSSKLDVDGEIRTDDDARFTSGARHKFVGGGSGNNLELGTYSSSNTSRDVHLVIDSAGRVGIGTSSPGAKLSIEEKTYVGAGFIRFLDNASSQTGTAMWRPASDTLAFNTNSTERLRIDSSGRLLVGLTSGSNRFHVKETNTNTIVGVVESSQSYAFLSLQASGTTAGAVRVGANGDDFVIRNATESVRVTSSGNVGIGTSSPGAKLSIAEQTYIGGGFIRFLSNASSQTGTAMWRPATDTLAFNTNSTERLRIDSSGNVGIGTTSPSTLLHLSSTGEPRLRIQDADLTNRYVEISQAGGGTFFRSRADSSNGSFIFSGLGGGTEDEFLRIDSSGNVGIGDTTPGEKLNVNGKIRSDHSSDSRFLLRVNNVNRGGFQASTDAGVVIYGASSTNPIRFQTSGSEKARIDTSGRLLVGTTSAVDTSDEAIVHVVDTLGARLVLGRNDTSVSAGNGLGGIRFAGNDTTSNTFTTLGEIICQADGTHAAGDNPTRLTFKTTSDGSSNVTERMRIDSSGRLGVGLTPSSTASITNVDAGLIQTDGNIDIRYAGSNTDPAGTRYLSLINTDSTLVAGQPMGGIRWVGNDTSNTSRDTASILAFCQNNTGTSSNITFNNNGGTERMRIDSSGNVGIGNSNPSQPLDVTGWVKTSVGLLGTYGRVGVGGSGGPEITTGALANPIKFIGGNGSTNLERMRIDSSGRLLVGLTSDLSGGTSSTAIQIATAGGGFLGLARNDTTVGTGNPLGGLRIYANDPSGYNDVGIIQCAGDGSHSSGDYPTRWEFYTTAENASSPTERMRIDSDGRLLVGSTTNQYTDAQLQVASDSGSTLFVYNTDVSATGQARLALGPSNKITGAQIKCIAIEDFSVSANRTAELAFETRQNGTLAERMRIDSSGNVGISTTSPSVRLHVASGSTQQAGTQKDIARFIASTAAPTNSGGLTIGAVWHNTDVGQRIAYLQSEQGLDPGGTARLLSLNPDGGNVGIGTTSPTQKLSLENGTFKISGTSTFASNVEIGRVGNDNNLAFATDGTERLRISNAGKFTASTIYSLTTTGGGPVYVESDGDLLRYTSSLKYKTDVETIEDARADAILNCRPVWYRSKCDNDIKTEGSEKSDWGWYGFIAEEVAEIEPRLVNWATKDGVRQEDGSVESVERDPADYEAEGVRYDNFVPLLVNIVKRQQAAIKTLEAKVAALESE